MSNLGEVSSSKFLFHYLWDIYANTFLKECGPILAGAQVADIFFFSVVTIVSFSNQGAPCGSVFAFEL